MIKDTKKQDINIYINFIKKYISFTDFKILKIDINTENIKYYKINVSYLDKKDNKRLFSEYIVEKKNNNSLLHNLSNKNLYKNNENEKDIRKENYKLEDILKIFYYENKWNIISEKEMDNYIKKTFGNIKDFFEILNKEFYYTYIINDEKISFLSKGKINNTEQIYNENINDILYNEYYTLIYKNDKDCKNKLTCINPKCIYKHPLNYDLKTAYKNYILNEKKKNHKYKLINCKYEDDLCEKNKYNKCIFKHDNDLIL